MSAGESPSFTVPASRWQRAALWVLPFYAERVRRRQVAGLQEGLSYALRAFVSVAGRHPEDYAHIRPGRHLHLMK